MNAPAIASYPRGSGDCAWIPAISLWLECLNVRHPKLAQPHDLFASGNGYQVLLANKRRYNPVQWFVGLLCGIETRAWLRQGWLIIRWTRWKRQQTPEVPFLLHRS